MLLRGELPSSLLVAQLRAIFLEGQLLDELIEVVLLQGGLPGGPFGVGLALFEFEFQPGFDGLLLLVESLVLVEFLVVLLRRRLHGDRLAGSCLEGLQLLDLVLQLVVLGLQVVHLAELAGHLLDLVLQLVQLLELRLDLAFVRVVLEQEFADLQVLEFQLDQDGLLRNVVLDHVLLFGLDVLILEQLLSELLDLHAHFALVVVELPLKALQLLLQRRVLHLVLLEVGHVFVVDLLLLLEGFDIFHDQQLLLVA